MTSDWRRRALERNREANRRYLAELDDHEHPDQHDEEVRRNWLEAARHYDSNATLREELTVRLSGEVLSHGALDFRVSDALLRPLRDGVSAAAHRRVELELTAISRGSTVLHIQPRVPEASGDASQASISVDVSGADSPMRDFLQLVSAAEAERDMRRWQHIMPALDSVVVALEHFELSLAMQWRSLDGAVRSSAISARGINHVAKLRKLETTRSRIHVTGRIAELRDSGRVKLKAGASRNSTSYDIKIPADDLLQMRLELGATASFRVEEVKSVDGLGREKSKSYKFLERIDGQGGFPGV